MPTSIPPYTNQQIAQILKDIATAYIIKKKNIFRITAYQEAAESIITNPTPIYYTWQKDPKLLDNIPKIGPSILTKIDYLFSKNKLHPSIIKAKKGIHPAVFCFTRINEIGPKTAYKLTKKLDFPKAESLALKTLIKYCQQDKIKNIKNFGRKSQQQILINSLEYLDKTYRIPLTKAQAISQKIIKYLKNKFPQTEFIPLGSLRRLTPTVGDIDIAAKSTNPTEIINIFTKYPNSSVIDKGPKKASIRLKNSTRIDLMVQSEKIFGSLLQHFTGSKLHNIKLRKFAKNKGYSLSEYGIKDLRSNKTHVFKTEKQFYNFLGLKLISPSVRVGDNEIEQNLMV